MNFLVYRFLSLKIYFLSAFYALFGQVSNSGSIGDSFYGINRHTGSSVVNNVGFSNSLILPQELFIKSEMASLYAGDKSKLDAGIRFDDGTLTSILHSDVNWNVSSPDVLIENGFLKAKEIDSNTRVSVEATSRGLQATLFIRLRKNVLSSDNSVTSISKNGALSNSTDLNIPGWKKSDWFGAYLSNDDNWIYHQHHGWLFSVSKLPNSLWMWSPSQKWLWTGPGIYPHIFRQKDGDWLYFVSQALPRKFYYNQSSKKLESAD